MLHNDVRTTRFETPHVEHPHDVLAVELCQGACFVHEPLLERWILEHTATEHFDRDRLVELDVAGENDHAHSTRTEDLLDSILAGDRLADSHRARRRRHSLLPHLSRLAASLRQESWQLDA